MTAQVAQDAESIKSVIKRELMERHGGILTSEEGTMRSVQKMLHVSCSGEKFDSAIGSLIKDRELVRHRPEPFGRDDEVRPMTIRFRQYSSSWNSYNGSFAR